MATTSDGRPHILVRLDSEVFERLREVAGSTESGRGGGMAFLVRCLIHRHLGLPDPVRHAAHVSPRKLKLQERAARGDYPKPRRRRAAPQE